MIILHKVFGYSCSIEVSYFKGEASMKWPRYRRIINLKIQVGITNQINKWANTDPGKIPEVGSGV
jgi:hypothetical protein